jgi:1-acyl-sn-glycerol-3-phosphate acyltransferase
MYLLGALIRFFTLWKPHGYYRPLCRATSIWGHGVARIWGMRMKVEGAPPGHPFVLISNHISYTDVVLLCAVCPTWFVSKQEVGSWPGIGALTRIALTVFINRETRRDVARLNILIAGLVRDGGSVIFFPEGTTSDGTAIQPFKSSLLQPAVDLGVPVHVAAIAYQTPAGSPPPESLVAWVGDDEFAPHLIRLLSAPGFTARLRFAGEPVQAPDRKTLSLQARDLLIRTHRELQENAA